MLLHQRLRPRWPRRVAGIGRRLRLWQFADEIGKCAKIVVGERLRHLVHGVEHPQLLAKHEKLDQRIWRLLATERGRIFGLGLPVFAMTGKTGRGALFDRFSSHRGREKGKRQSRKHFTHRTVLTLSFVIARSESDEAIHSLLDKGLDCFAEPVIGRRVAPTRWLPMTCSWLPTATPPSACRS